MKTSYLGGLLIANILGVNALDTIAQYTSNIPECSFASFKKAAKSENCAFTDFDCICNHTGSIVIVVAKSVDDQCSADFSQALGSACGIWMALGSTASDYAQATSILAKDLSGDSSGSSATKTASDSDTSATQSASDSASAATQSASGSATAASATSSNMAAMPTVNKGVTGLVGLVGGVAAVAGMMI